MRAVRYLIRTAIVLLLLGLAILLVYGSWRGRPQDLPWTDLDLGQPTGAFTGRKLTALARDFPACRAALDRAGVRYQPLPPRHERGCGYDDGVRCGAGGPRAIGFAPPGLGVACPVAAALSAWEWNVVQPAAQRWFGSRVTTIDHFGSYSCRRLYGRDTGNWSEHATADAVDIAGFRLADSTRVTVARDWRGQSAKASFLREVRDGACRLFATTLSPDYNAAHRDHLHLDQAERGMIGGGVCR